MAKPRYIICATDCIVSRDTGLVSHINVIESLNIVPLKTDDPRAPFLKGSPSILMDATWTREEGDENKEFEFQIRLSGTWNDKEPDVVGQGVFTFEKDHHRIIANIHAVFRSYSGYFIVENRIREKGSEQWISQEYPIMIQLTQKVEA